MTKNMSKHAFRMKFKILIWLGRWQPLPKKLNTIDIFLLAKIFCLEFCCLLCRNNFIWKTCYVVCFDKIKLLKTTYIKYLANVQKNSSQRSLAVDQENS